MPRSPPLQGEKGQALYPGAKQWLAPARVAGDGRRGGSQMPLHHPAAKALDGPPPRAGKYTRASALFSYAGVHRYPCAMTIAMPHRHRPTLPDRAPLRPLSAPSCARTATAAEFLIYKCVPCVPTVPCVRRTEWHHGNPARSPCPVDKCDSKDSQLPTTRGFPAVYAKLTFSVQTLCG